MANYEVQGLKQLEQALTLLGKKASKKVLKGALREAARPTVKGLRKRIPKNSGALRKSVGVKVLKTGSLWIGYRMGKRYRGFVGKFLEEGTKSHNIGLSGKQKARGRRGVKTPYGVRANVRVSGIQARPMLRPALDATHKEAIAIFKRRVKERVILETINQSKAYK